MQFTETEIAGAWVIDAEKRHDNRGYFMRAWCQREFAERGINFVPLQANMGFSLRKGTVRGMHFQVAPAPEAKLVRCTRGRVYDVVLDLRKGSATYGKWRGIELSAENGRMLYLPEQCGHGFQTLEDTSEIHYMASAFYTPQAVRGARYDDPAFDVRWPLAISVISDQDRNWPLTQK